MDFPFALPTVEDIAPQGTPLLEALAILGGITLVVLTFVFWLLSRTFRTRKSFSLIITGLLVGTLGWIAGLAHLWIFDRFFIRDGRCAPSDENT